MKNYVLFLVLLTVLIFGVAYIIDKIQKSENLIKSIDDVNEIIKSKNDVDDIIEKLERSTLKEPTVEAEKLFGALRKNDIAKIKELLDGGINSNLRNAFGITALMYASMNNRFECAEKLLKSGARVNDQDGNETALSFAVVDGYCKLAKLLLDNEADPNIKPDNISGSETLGGITLLESAIISKNMEECSNEEMVKLLVENGADIEALGTLNMTPLMFAAQNGHLNIAKILINNGANIDTKNRITGATALVHASGSKNIEIAKLLLDNGADISIKGEGGFDAMSIAKEMNDKEMVEFLSAYK